MATHIYPDDKGHKVLASADLDIVEGTAYIQMLERIILIIGAEGETNRNAEATIWLTSLVPMISSK